MKENLVEKVAALNLSNGMHEVSIEGQQAHVSKVGESLVIFMGSKTVISAAVINV